MAEVFAFSGGDGANCVELAQGNAGILIRESDTPGTVIAADRAKLAAFIQGVKAGEFDHLLVQGVLRK